MHLTNKFRQIFDKIWIFFFTSQKIIHPVKKLRKFRPQMNEKHFQLDKKLFRQPEKIEFLNYLKTTWKGPMSFGVRQIHEDWRTKEKSLSFFVLFCSVKLLGVPWSPLESLGVPWSPLESLGVPWIPLESLWVPGLYFNLQKLWIWQVNNECVYLLAWLSEYFFFIFFLFFSEKREQEKQFCDSPGEYFTKSTWKKAFLHNGHKSD